MSSTIDLIVVIVLLVIIRGEDRIPYTKAGVGFTKREERTE